MASFKIVVMAVGLVFTLGFINASAIPDQLNLKYNPADTENDEGAMVDFQKLLLNPAQSSMDAPPSCKCEGTVCNCCNTINIIKRQQDEEKDEQKKKRKKKGKKKKEKKKKGKKKKKEKKKKGKKKEKKKKEKKKGKKKKEKKKKEKKEEIRETACVEVQYKKEDSSFGIKVTFGSEALFDGTKSATGGAPTCFKYPEVPGSEFCLDVTDFKSEEGEKTHGCVSISAKLAKPVTFQLGCFDLTPEEKDDSALTYYHYDPGEDAEEIEPSTGWVEIEENAPLPDEDYLIMGAYDEYQNQD